MPVMKSSHTCQQEISKSGILKGSSCTEQHVFRPFSRESSGAMTESKQTLKYTTERNGVSTASKNYFSIFILKQNAFLLRKSFHEINFILFKIRICEQEDRHEF